MSKLTLTNSAGAALDIPLPDGVDFTFPAPPAPKLQLGIDNPQIHVGDTFTVTVMLDGQPAKGYKLYGFARTVINNDGTEWGPKFTALAASATTIKCDSNGMTASLPVTVLPAVAVVPPPVSPPPPPPVTVDPPQSGSGNVYADALANLVLPVKTPWSNTRPAYIAQSEIRLTGSTTLADGTVLPDGTILTCDTSKQVPDYVPYIGMWYYPYLLPDGSRHPDLLLKCYADGAMIGNVFVDGSANYAGHHTITINGEVVEDTDDTYAFGTCTVPCREGLPQATPARNWDPMMVPNYGKVPGGYKPFTDQLAAADNSPTGRSLTTPYNSMSTQGAQYSIGILHGAMIPWVVDGGDANWTVVRTVEDHAWRWPVLLLDRLTGLPAYPCIPHCRDVSILPNCPNQPGHINPVKTKENSPLQADPAHTPRFGVVGYLSTGSMIDLESLLCWGAYACYWGNPAYSQYEKCISYEQTRGIAWDNLSKAYAAKLCPADHPLHDLLQTVVANNAAALDALYGANGTNKNPFGIVAHGFQYEVNGATAFPPWQQDFLAQSTHQIIDLGFPGWDGVASYLDTFTDARMGDGVTGLFWTTAPFYAMTPLVPGCTAVNPTPADFVADWPTFNAQNLTTHGRASEIGKTVDQADVGAGPGKPIALSGTPTNYWANYQPCVADLGIDSPEWIKFAAEILPHQDYSTGGQFNIVPRPKLAEAA